MSQHGLPPEYSQWTTEQREPGWFGRLVTPVGGGRPVTAAFLVGILAAAAFVASLSLDWLSVTPPADLPTSSTTVPESVADNITSPFLLGLVYALSGVALLGLLGASLTRPELALRLRMAVSGVTVALVGVVVASTIRLPEQLISPFGLPPASGFRTSYEPGIFCAYAASVLPMLAVWLAARPAARALLAGAAGGSGGTGGTTEDGRTRGSARHAAQSPDPDPLDIPPRRGSSWGDGSRGLSVAAAEPLDLNVSPDPNR